MCGFDLDFSLLTMSTSSPERVRVSTIEWPQNGLTWRNNVFISPLSILSMSGCSLASVIRLTMMSSGKKFGICSDCSWICGRWDSPGSSSAQPLTSLASVILALGNIMATHRLSLLLFRIAAFEIFTWCCCIKTQWAHETILVPFERKVRARFIPATQSVKKKSIPSPKEPCTPCTRCWTVRGGGAQAQTESSGVFTSSLCACLLFKKVNPWGSLVSFPEKLPSDFPREWSVREFRTLTK